MSRRLRLSLLAAGLVAGAGGFAWLALPALTETLIAGRLAALGLQPVTVDVSRIGLSGAHVARLEAGEGAGALLVRDADLAWSLAGGLGTLTVAEARVIGRWSAETGVDLGPLEALLAGEDGPDAGPPSPFALPVEQVKLERATASLALPQGELEATVSGTIKRADPGPALSLTADVTAPGLSGTLTFAGTAGGGGTLPASGDGWLRVAADDFAAPGLAGSVTGTVAAAVRVGADAVALRADAPVQLALTNLEPAIRSMLAPYLGEPASPLVLHLAGAADDKAPVMTISGLSDAAGIVFSSERLTATARTGDAEAHIAASGTLRVGGEAAGAVVREVSATVDGISIGGVPATVSLTDGTLTLSAKGLAAGGSVSGSLRNVPLGGSGIVDEVAFDSALRLTAQPDKTGALFADRGRVVLTGLRPTQDVAATTPVILDLEPSEGPLVRLDRTAEGAPAAVLSTALASPAVTLATPQGPASAAFGSLQVTAALAAGQPVPVLAVTGHDGILAMGDAEVRDAHLEAGLTDAGPSVSLTGAMAALPGEPAELARRSPLRPYRLSIAAVPSEAAEAPLDLTAELRDVGNTLLASARGVLDPSDGSGKAQVRVPRQVFDPQGLKPEHLHGLLGSFVHDVTGAIAVDGTLRWNEGGLRPNLKVLLQDVGLTQGFVALTRINGVVTLTGLSPLRTPKGQQVSVAAIDAGLPLLDAVANFEIARDTLLLDSASATLAGGTIRARPTAIPLNLDQGTTTLDVHGLRLGPLVDLAGIQGLRAKGELAGTVPLRFAGGDVIIDNAVLTNTKPEQVTYAPDDVPAALSGGGESVGLVLEAMQDFRYEELSLTVDGRASGQMTVKLHIAGANPSFYDGYPVEFNLTVSGELAKAVQAGLSGYRVPDRIRERMEEFRSAP